MFSACYLMFLKLWPFLGVFTPRVPQQQSIARNGEVTVKQACSGKILGAQFVVQFLASTSFRPKNLTTVMFVEVPSSEF